VQQIVRGFVRKKRSGRQPLKKKEKMDPRVDMQEKSGRAAALIRNSGGWASWNPGIGIKQFFQLIFN
jgi:hypothetical protein